MSYLLHIKSSLLYYVLRLLSFFITLRGAGRGSATRCIMGKVRLASFIFIGQIVRLVLNFRIIEKDRPRIVNDEDFLKKTLSFCLKLKNVYKDASVRRVATFFALIKSKVFPNCSRFFFFFSGRAIRFSCSAFPFPLLLCTYPRHDTTSILDWGICRYTA